MSKFTPHSPMFLGSHQTNNNNHHPQQQQQQMQLTAGVVEAFMTSEHDRELDRWPVLQILQLREMPNAGPGGAGAMGSGQGSKRWRVIVSDGVHSMSCLLGLPLHHAVESGTIRPNSIIKVDTSMTSIVQNRKVAVLVGLTLLSHSNETIGSPVPFSSAAAAAAAAASSGQGPNVTHHPMGHGPHGAPATSGPTTHSPQPLPPTTTTSTHTAASSPYMSTTLASTVGGVGSVPAPTDVVMIRDLSPYSSAWTIQVRLTSKSEIKHWSNARGEGQLFSAIFMDASGDIRVTAFNQAVDAFYTRLVEQQVYWVRGCKVKLAQKEYNTTSCPYELVFEDKTEVIPCPATTAAALPALHLTPVPIASLRDADVSSMVDILGVLTHVQPCMPYVAKSSQREMVKRDMGLVDTSGWQVRLTVWGKHAQEMPFEVGHVLACKHVKVSEFNGKNLSSLHSSTLLLDPDLPQAHRLLGWYQQHHGEDFPALSAGAGAGSQLGTQGPGAPVREPSAMELVPVAEVLARESEERMVWVDATVVFVRESPFMYEACPQCNKKVLAGMCEKCQAPVPHPHLRYIVQVCLADATGQLWATVFNDTGETLLAQPANSLTQDPARIHTAALHANFQHVLVKLKSRTEMYQDEARVKHTVLELLPYRNPPLGASDLWLHAAQRAGDEIKQLMRTRRV